MRRSPTDCLVVALDVDTGEAAWKIVRLLRGRVGMFKVGSELFVAEGPSLVRDFVREGLRVFLDLKFHDIPHTVERAVWEAVELGVALVDVHTGGGVAMMQAAARAVRGQEGCPTRVLGVTVLTSLAEEDLQQIGFQQGAPSFHVRRLARLAQTAGLDGVVAAPGEIAALRAELGPEFILLAPGIRPAGVDTADHQRAATPAVALRAGADYLVVGRPIIQSPDPLATAEAILQEMETCR